MPGYLENLGMQAGGQAAGNLINEGMGIAFAGIKNKQQARQHKRLTNINIDAEKHLTDFNFKKQLEMWEKTGYGAQVKQMQEAGINPALMYGMGGGGGQSSSVQTGSSGGTGAQIAAASSGMGIQMPLIAAQVENLKAQTEKTKAETANVPLEGEKTKAETASITQGISNQKTQNELMGIQDSLLRNELFEKYKTQDWRFSLFAEQANEAIGKAKTAMAQGNVDEKTQQEKIDILKADAAGALLRNAQTETQTRLTEEQIKSTQQQITASIAKVAQDWKSLSLEEKRVKADLIMKNVEQIYEAQGVGPFKIGLHDKGRVQEALIKLLE